MIVDFHTHLMPPSFEARRSALAMRDRTFGVLFRRGAGKMASAEQLIDAMDRDGVDVSVVLGYGWCDRDTAYESNDYLLDAMARFPERLIAYCSVHPGWGDQALIEIERCVKAGARGIGELHPASQQIDLATDEALGPMMALSVERILPVLIHGSEAVGHAYAGKGTTTPDQLLAFSQRFPDATCVFAHWGGGLPFYGLMPEVRRALANVYFDSAASPLLYDRRVFDVVVRSVGVEHVLFGSDYPLLPVNQVAEQVRATLDVDAASSVLRGNAARLLGLIDG